jgi:hypothetical protein
MERSSHGLYICLFSGKWDFKSSGTTVLAALFKSPVTVYHPGTAYLKSSGTTG